MVAAMTIADGGEANGTLTGSGALNLNGGMLTVTAENSTWQRNHYCRRQRRC